MLQRPKIPSEALSSAFSWEARVDSWLGQTWLGRVPVKAGSVTWTTSQQVQGTLSLTVPRIGAVSQDEGARDWTPLAPDSPLATMGQVLHVQVTVASLVSTDRWDIPLGRFLITQWEVGATDIRITGKSLFQHLEDDRLTSPTVPYSGGTLASELRRLVGGHMGVIVSDALTNRPCPSMSWGESRIDAIYDEVYTNSTTPSVLMDLNAIEWNINHETSMRSVQERISEMEMALLGKTGEGTFKKRISALSMASFGTKDIPVTSVSVPANTLIKIALVTPVNAKDLKVGDTIEYQVADDVFVGDTLVFTKGSRGEGTVTKVRQARNFGRNAQVEIDFKSTKALDGTYVTTYIGEEAKKEMEHLAMAAGASLAGIAVLGPIGVVAGAFVRGKNVDHPAGTELYIQTKDETTLYGVQTTYDSAAPFQSTAARTSDTTTTNDEGYDNSVYNDAA